MSEENNISTQEEADDYRKLVADAEWGDSELPPVETADNEPVELDAGANDVLDDLPEAGEADPFEGIDPLIMAKFEEMSGKIDGVNNLEYRLKQAESRVGSLQNELHKKKTAAPAPVIEPVKDDNWDALKTEFPEWEDVLDGVDKKFGGKRPDVDAIRTELETNFNSKLTEVQKGFEVKLVGIKHPDWKKDIASAEYKAWLPMQPADIQYTANHSDNSEEVIGVLDKFSDFRNKSGPKVQGKKLTRLEKSQSVRGSTIARAKSEDQMTDKEYREHIAQTGKF